MVQLRKKNIYLVTKKLFEQFFVPWGLSASRAPAEGHAEAEEEMENDTTGDEDAAAAIRFRILAAKIAMSESAMADDDYVSDMIYVCNKCEYMYIYIYK